jgi:hypothetical protein
MPDPAPASRPRQQDDNFRREYLDALRRPLTGQVMLTPVGPPTQPVPVTLQLVDGVAAARITPGTYVLNGLFRTQDGNRMITSDTVIVEP